MSIVVRIQFDAVLRCPLGQNIHAALGSKRDALAFLDKAAEERSSRIVEIQTEPVFRSLRESPGFAPSSAGSDCRSIAETDDG